MKKTKGWIFVFLIAIVSILMLFWIIKTPLISSYLSNKLKTNVTLSKVSFSFKRMHIDNFKLKNTRKTKTKYAFIAKTIEINYAFPKLLSSPTVIDDILISNINLNIDCYNPLCTSNNWTEIVNNIRKKEEKTKVVKKEIIIKKLILKNMIVQISGFGLDLKEKTVQIPRLEFKNISNKTGFPTEQLIAAIFKSAGLQNYLKEILEPKKALENIFKGLKFSKSDNIPLIENSKEYN